MSGLVEFVEQVYGVELSKGARAKAARTGYGIARGRGNMYDYDELKDIPKRARSKNDSKLIPGAGMAGEFVGEGVNSVARHPGAAAGVGAGAAALGGGGYILGRRRGRG